MFRDTFHPRTIRTCSAAPPGPARPRLLCSQLQDTISTQKGARVLCAGHLLKERPDGGGPSAVQCLLNASKSQSWLDYGTTHTKHGTRLICHTGSPDPLTPARERLRAARLRLRMLLGLRVGRETELSHLGCRADSRGVCWPRPDIPLAQGVEMRRDLPGCQPGEAKQSRAEQRGGYKRGYTSRWEERGL